MIEKEYLIALSGFVPFGPKRLSLLMKYFGSSELAYKASIQELSAIGLSEKMISDFDLYRNSFDESKYFLKIEERNIDIVTIFEDGYPECLKEIDSAPFVLYVRGKITSQDKNAIAIVGSRKMTTYGREVAKKFTEGLTDAGVTIVSGLARGVDAVAHATAISNGGRTIAVLAGGIDDIYPPENISLANNIVASGSALISEFPLGYPHLPHNFVYRNRIVSGLSRGVLVVQGRLKSGTLTTAKHASEQGRDVFAVPGDITNPLSEAPNYLLQNGAKIAVSPNDILSELGETFMLDTKEREKVLPELGLETDIVGFLSNSETHLDELVRMIGASVHEVSATLTIMEMKGIVKSVGDGVYRMV